MIAAKNTYKSKIGGLSNQSPRNRTEKSNFAQGSMQTGNNTIKRPSNDLKSGFNAYEIANDFQKVNVNSKM